MQIHKKMLFTNTPLNFTSSSSSSFSFLKHPHTSSFSFSTFSSFKKNPLPKPPLNPPKTPFSPWLKQWPPIDPPPPFTTPPINSISTRNPNPNPNPSATPSPVENKGVTAIDKIVGKLRNLGYMDDDDDSEDDDEDGDGNKLGNLLKRDWIRPDTMLVQENRKSDLKYGLLPWEIDDAEVDDVGDIRDRIRVRVREDRDRDRDRERERESDRKTRRVVKEPTLAEKLIEEGELKRLRGLGMKMGVRDKVNVAKAGVTQAVLVKIHEKWRKCELVRLKFHEDLAHDMKTAHIIVEQRTKGLVLWRSGSVMVVYRGPNYEGPPAAGTVSANASATAGTGLAELPHGYRENLTAEELEYNDLLDGLGPRFVDWWGTGVLPIDADLLPEVVDGYKPPARSLPVGMRVSVTNDELTELRKLTKKLPCHFALGRNRKHQGLAAAIVKLWEKSVVAKIAVKRGVQNTNNELMSEELKRLTGGTLLLRNKFFIVIYRGKDFLPASVSAALSERIELTKKIEDAEERARIGAIETDSSNEPAEALAGTLAEFYEAQARWGKELSPDECEKVREAASRAKTLKEVKRIEHKLSLAQSKKLRAEKLLSKIESTMVAVGPSDDQETITDEEKFTFRKIGLQMKAYLPVGVRGIFDGVIENMHLHWKHRELVKLISKQKNLSFVEETARLLEHESGGILVAIERVPKGFALIYYRGKNYQRPISLRPRNLLTKAKALKRAIAMQRHEALSQHIFELEKNIDECRKEMPLQGISRTSEDEDTVMAAGELGPISEFQSADEDSYTESEDEDDEDDDLYYSDDEDEGDADSSSIKGHGDSFKLKN